MFEHFTPPQEHTPLLLAGIDESAVHLELNLELGHLDRLCAQHNEHSDYIVLDSKGSSQ
jgi:hypothetical protein